MIPNFWTNTTWAATTAALLCAIAWVVTSIGAFGWAALAWIVVTLISAYIAAGDVVDDHDAQPHPLDPHTEELRRRLAMGRPFPNPYSPPPRRDDEDEDRGW